MAGPSMLAPPPAEEVFGNLYDLIPIDSLDVLGQNFQVYSNEMELNPFVPSEEHVIAIATERSMLSIPTGLTPFEQELQLQASLSDTIITSIKRESSPM